MSNFGQGVAAVAGAVVGFVVGGPTGAAYGFQIGLLAGSALFPTQLPGVQGPRLEDLDQTAAEPGAPVPIAYGTIAVTGATVWLGPVVETSETEEVGGKGAPEQSVTTYSYFQGVALGICEGPITAVVRIWENGKLVYDARAQQDAETDDEFSARLAASEEYATNFDLYTGTETQEPDPTIEADKGVGNVPAWRGLAYIVYPNRQLQDDQARRHPVFKFEVSNNAAQDPIVVFEASGTWIKPAGLLSAEVTVIAGGGGGAGGGAVANNGFPRTGGGGGGGGLSIATFAADALPDAVAVIVGSGGAGGNGADSTGTTEVEGEPGLGGTGSSFGAFLSANGGSPGGVIGNCNVAGAGGTGSSEQGGDGGTGRSSNGLRGGEPGESGESTTQSGAGGAAGGGTERADGAGGGSGGFGGNTSEVSGGIPGISCAGAGGCTGTVGDVGDTSPTYRGGGGGGGGGAGSGNISGFAGPGLGGHGGIGGRYGGGGGGGGSGQGRITETADAVANGGAGGDGGQGVVVVRQTFATVGITLADVVEDVCHRAGLYEIDVEDLRAIPIDGYVVARPMPGRSAIEPLRSFGFFDVVESGGVLKFVTRGKPVVATLTASDLGAHTAGEQPPPAITTRKLQDPEMPRSVRVKYQDIARDYEQGQQASPSRITTDAQNDIDVELPIAMSGTKAAQIAEVLWADAWRSRWVHQMQLAPRWLELEPTDCLEVPVDGRVQRMRIVSIDDSGPELRRLELVRDDDGSTVSYAVAADPDRRPNALTVLNGSALLLLDIPMLRDADNDAGFYAAAYPTGSGNVWNGAVVYKSVDDGQTFNPIASITSPVPTGVIALALADGITSTFDESVTLTVDMDYGTLESRTEAAVLNGANAAVIGEHGRWQMIQFRDVEQLTPTRFLLSGILRGRRGTEHFANNSQAGDRFVLVSGGQLIRVPVQNSEIGSARLFRSVSIGAAYSSGTQQAFTPRAVALECFSPADIAPTLAAGGDVVVTWLRRDRISQELRDGVEIPMSEGAELYEVDVYVRPDLETPVRTLASSTQSATYSAAQQAEDFGSPLAVFADLAFAVYQVSDTVGRGTPGYYPEGIFEALEGQSDIAAEAGRSASLDYLEYAKGEYPETFTGDTLEFRHRNPTAGFVVDIVQYAPGGNTMRRYEDGESESSGSAGALHVVAYAPSADPRYFFIAQLYGGTTLTASGPGKLRKVDSNAFARGEILSSVTVAEAAGVGLSGDPESIVVIGDAVFAACPFGVTVKKYSAADLSQLAEWATDWPAWTLAARGTELWALERTRPSPRLFRIDTDTGATIDTFTVAPFCVDMVIAGNFAYLVSSDDAMLYKYNLDTGTAVGFGSPLPAFADLSGEAFGQLRNYLTLDGTRLSIGRSPTIFVIDTATDEQVAP